MIDNRPRLKGTTKAFIGLFLIVVVLLFILPPAVYHYDYPTRGDDTFRHLEQIDRLDAYYSGEIGSISTAYQRYPGQNYTWLLWQPFKAMGTSADQFFVWFNWLAMAVVALSLFWFGYRLWNWQAGIAVVLLAMFSAKAMSYLFYNGTIYDIINMYVFGLQGFLALILWQREKRQYYMVLSLLLFCLAGIYHSSSGLIIMAGVLAYLGCTMLYQLYRKDRTEFIRILVYSVRFFLLAVVLGLLLNHESSMLAQNVSVVSAESSTEFSASDPVPFMTWMFDSCSPWCLPLIVLFAWILKQRRAKIDWKPIALLGCFIAVLSVGSFTRMWYDHPRFALELGIMVAILCGGLVGLALKARKNKVFGVAIAVVLIGSGLPTIYQYAHYSSCYTPADRACVEYLNELEGESWNCSSQIQPQLYGRFVTAKLYNGSSADYTIYRNEPITPESDPENYSWNFNEWFDRESNESDYEGLEIVGQWSYQDIEVVLYRR